MTQYIVGKIKNYPLSCFLIVCIWIVCMIPIPENPLSHVRLIDKWTHFAMYGTLTITIWLEHYRHHRHEKPWLNLFIGGFICPVAMGGMIELAQAYLTTCRSGDWLDFLCNSLGVCLGMIIASIVKAVWSRMKK